MAGLRWEARTADPTNRERVSGDGSSSIPAQTGQSGPADRSLPDAKAENVIKWALNMAGVATEPVPGEGSVPEPGQAQPARKAILKSRSEAERDQYLGNQAHTQFICVWIAPNCTDICVGDFVLSAPRWKFWLDALAY